MRVHIMNVCKQLLIKTEIAGNAFKFYSYRDSVIVFS